MNKSLEQLDSFSAENRQKFDLLSAEDKNRIISRAKEEADKLTQMIHFGMAQDYAEAAHKLDVLKEAPPELSIFIDENTNMFIDLGGGRTFLGNPLDGTITEVDGESVCDFDLYEKNLQNILGMVDQLREKPKGMPS